VTAHIPKKVKSKSKAIKTDQNSSSSSSAIKSGTAEETSESLNMEQQPVDNQAGPPNDIIDAHQHAAAPFSSHGNCTTTSTRDVADTAVATTTVDPALLLRSREGWGSKSVDNLLVSIESRRTLPMHK
jgi:hypothetical protein